MKPIPISVAKTVIVRHHYLHLLPGGTRLAFGISLSHSVLGALPLGVGPFNAHQLVVGANPNDSLTLTRFWWSDSLAGNSESRVLGIVLRTLKRNSLIKFLVSYADPAQGHLGITYQATGWLDTGPSQASPLPVLGDGEIGHSRSFSHAFGAHSLRHFASHGVPVTTLPQQPKHGYVYFLDPDWQEGLRVPILAYPK